MYFDSPVSSWQELAQQELKRQASRISTGTFCLISQVILDKSISNFHWEKAKSMAFPDIKLQFLKIKGEIRFFIILCTILSKNYAKL